MSAKLHLVTDDRGTPPRRFRPRHGLCLTMGCIRGPWRPTAAVAASGVFAIVWETYNGSFWAPLHDFDAPTQLRLIEACRRLDIEAFGAPR